MGQPLKNNYSAADIERYHSGKMSEAEKHALEKTALEDPFLADALEGYVHSADATKEINLLKQRLQEKTSERKVVPFLLRNRNWMKAAAILVVIACTWIIFRKPATEKNNIAFKTGPSSDSTKIAEAVSGALKSNTDSAIGNGSVVMNEPEAAKMKKEVYHLDKTLPPATVGRTYAFSTQDKEHKKHSREKDQVAASADMPASLPDTYRAPVVSARVFLNDSLRTANQDQITTQTVSGADDTIKNLNVVLKPLDRPMNEVVVAKTANRKQAPPESYVIIDTLEPTGGWVKFDDYIANNIRRPEEIKDKQISGEVLLSFDIDKNGAPQNITVEKSLCPTCDQEAIRLLKEGPKWEKKKNKKGKVKIRF